MGETKRRPDGFFERGQQVTRLEAFVDAAFAFAVTLLIVSFDRIPESYAELIVALKGTPAFAASFALVAMFWYAHHNWSRRFGLDNFGSVFISLVLVFLVLIWVFPLRLLFAAAFAWLSDLALPPDSPLQIPWTVKMGSRADFSTAFIIYAVAWSSLGIVIALLNWQGWRHRHELGLDLDERVATRAEIARWLWVPVTGLMSIGVTLALPADPPGWMYGAPGMIYSLMGLTGVVMTLSARRWRPRIEAELLADATVDSPNPDDLDD